MATTETPIDEIRSLCRRYSHPGVNPGTHALAYRVLGIIEKHERTQMERMEANGTEEKKGRGEQ